MTPLPTVGVDLGGTNVRVALVAADGTVLDEVRAPTPATLDGIVDHIAAVERGFRERAAAGALGVGAAGMVDFAGVIHYSPNVSAFRGAPVAERLAAATGLPVVVDNDANVAIVGEHAHGAAVGCSDALLVTLGTGVGGGVLVAGRVLRGAHGFAAEVGHFQVDPAGPVCACGQRGCWEATASGTALGALGRTAAHSGAAPSVLALVGGDPDAVRGEHVGEAARAGHADAVALLALYARNVATGLVGLTNLFDPERILVSGGLVELGDVLLDPVRTEFAGRIEGAAFRPSVPIVPAVLGDRAGIVGAAVLARDLLAPA